ncbi:YciI family protein [Sorangium sp. So ce124]|uniref:YciI family protein n=1 Tax=Sorangium sp. So ce124 TaxID=3133280 RepID=UPI003F6127B3
MKYVLMMHVPTRQPYELMSWPPKDLEAHLAFLNSFNQKLRESGELVGIEALTAPDQARLVRAGKDGKPITDGVFPEAKEFLAGFWMVDVGSPERAYELAAQASAAPGPGGEPLNMAIEVRQVMSGSELPKELL